MTISKSLLFICCLLAVQFSFAQQNSSLKFYFETNSTEVLQFELPNNTEQWEAVQVVGYADYIGVYNKNIDLSMRRATAIAELLQENGVQVDSIVGKGSTGPDLLPKEGHAQSRRVEVFYQIAEEIEEDIAEEVVDSILDEVIPEEEPIVLSEEQVLIDNQLLETEVGATMILHNINFKPGRAELLPQSIPVLEDLLLILKKHPNVKINIEGHICCSNEVNAKDGLNMDSGTYSLSVDRARKIYYSLIDNGISPSRLSYEGFAKKRPLYPYERTQAEMSANRRVEIRILEK